jgi:hypothetical protein
MSSTRTRLLGAYLVFVCSLQICGFVAETLWPDRFYWLFYLNPRIGLLLLELVSTGREGSVPGAIQWIAAGWILLLGIALFFGWAVVRTYIVSEILLALPSLILIVISLRSSLSPFHSLTVKELFIPLLVITFYTVVPLVWAVRLRRPRKLGFGVAC